MVGCSLRHRGEELLGQRGGLAPMSPSAARWGSRCFTPGRTGSAGALRGRRPGGGDRFTDALSVDPNGLPIHGLLAAAGGWKVERHEARGDEALIAASFDFGAHDGVDRRVPFPHTLLVEATLAGRADDHDASARRRRAGADLVRLPPLLQLPGVDRADWEIEISPGATRLDDRMLPTGDREVAAVAPGPLGSRTFDDAYVGPARIRPVRRGRRWATDRGRVRRRLPFAQVYAPADDDVIALEPMTAPTNALVAGGAGAAARGAGRIPASSRSPSTRAGGRRMQRRRSRACGVDRLRPGGARTPPGEIVHVLEAWEEPAGGGAVAAVQLARLAGELSVPHRARRR